MKIHSIYPSEESEKAISNYTKQLIKAQRKQGLKINDLTYTAGDYSTLDLSNIKDGDVVHIQHEYNLFGQYGLPFFRLYKTLRDKKAKIITTMHNVLSQNHKFKGNPLKTFLRKQLYIHQNKIINVSSDKTIVHAKFFKDILVDEYGFLEEDVIVLRQGILEDVKITPQAKAKKELGLKGKVYLLIGSLVPDHGADIILKQAKEIDGTIVVAASDKAINDRNDDRQTDWLSNLKDIVDENEIENVRFDIKELPYKLWWKYFSAADMVLLPYSKGIGSGIFADCIATKTPMVGSNIEYFREFEASWDFIGIAWKEDSYMSAINEMLKTDKLWLGLEFDNYIKEHGMIALAKKYKEVYNGL